jgi:ABC-type uncharacterized transport system ATPase component
VEILILVVLILLNLDRHSKCLHIFLVQSFLERFGYSLKNITEEIKMELEQKMEKLEGGSKEAFGNTDDCIPC